MRLDSMVLRRIREGSPRFASFKRSVKRQISPVREFSALIAVTWNFCPSIFQRDSKLLRTFSKRFATGCTVLYFALMSVLTGNKLAVVSTGHCVKYFTLFIKYMET